MMTSMIMQLQSGSHDFYSKILTLRYDCFPVTTYKLRFLLHPLHYDSCAQELTQSTVGDLINVPIIWMHEELNDSDIQYQEFKFSV